MPAPDQPSTRPLENQGHQGAAHQATQMVAHPTEEAHQAASHSTEAAHQAASRVGDQTVLSGMAQESQVAAAAHQAAAQGGSQEQQEAQSARLHRE